MKILKEAKNVLNLKLNDYKKFYGTLTRLTESEFKKLVSLKSDNDKSNEIKDVLNSLAKIAISDKASLPENQCKFLTDYYNNDKEALDFNKLVKDSNFNLLRVRGMLVALMFKSVLRPRSYYRFLSLFSPVFNNSSDKLPNDLSFIILNSFAEALGINNISSINKFIKDYLNTDYFSIHTPTREVFEKVYNDYVSNPSFNVKKIFSGDDSTEEDDKKTIIL